MTTSFAHALRGLYLVTPDWNDTDALLRVTEHALQGGATLVQYRHKTADADLRRTQAHALLSCCRAHGVPLIINDHLDLCLEIGADGLHVGGTDLAPAQVRAALGSERLLGVSCYGTIERATQAVAHGADYVAFGGFFPSRIKKYAVDTDPSILEQTASLGVPRVVIGGMTLENCAPLVARGAEMVAVISSVYFAPDPRAAAQELAALFD